MIFSVLFKTYLADKCVNYYISNYCTTYCKMQNELENGVFFLLRTGHLQQLFYAKVSYCENIK